MMAAEKLSDTIDLYRFNEANGTYTSVCILVYNERTVTIKALPSAITNQDRRELSQYLISKGVTDCYYERRKSHVTLLKRWKLKIKCEARTA